MEFKTNYPSTTLMVTVSPSLPDCIMQTDVVDDNYGLNDENCLASIVHSTAF